MSGAATASFGYDGDGNRVIGTEGGATTVYIGKSFEWKGSQATMVRYYYAGGERVAMRTGAADPQWLLGDHLGSTTVVANYNGSLYAGQGYKAWGEQRYWTGITPLPTTFRYTGQRESASFGLYYYGARWYDPALGRFVQADSIVPLASQGVQAWDRYAYTNNNPVRYTDPSGHDAGCSAADPACKPQNTYSHTPVAYSDWYSGQYSGCAMCHYSYGTQNTRLTNTQLAEAQNNATTAAGGAAVAAAVGAAVGIGLGVAGIGGLAKVACGDGDCTNELTAVAKTSNNATSNTTSAIVQYYPPNNGFQGEPILQTLQPGTLVSRYGSTYGKFLSPAGTPDWARALPPGVENLQLNTYTVAKSFDVWAGVAASWFGKIGSGTQYYTGDAGPTIQTLIEMGVLK